mmetsp:Transcript_89379/g.255212  ORF Transcript_89379/g.255212 Transcript_89379/m.255212 type:complete len:202 (+) Transcript_89379:1116-1721(+)
MGAVGAAGSRRLVPLFGVKRSIMGVLAAFVLLTVVWMFVSSRRVAFGFAFGFGICYGVVHPVQRTGFASLVPGGQEAEYAGLFTFSGMVLSWAVPLLFVVLNETTGSVTFGLFAPMLFHTIGFFILSTIDFDAAREPVLLTLDRRGGVAFHGCSPAENEPIAEPAPTIEMTATQDLQNRDDRSASGGALVKHEAAPAAVGM